MKITVKVGKVKITVDEQGLSDKTTTIKWGDQTKLIQETVSVMAEQCAKLQKSLP